MDKSENPVILNCSSVSCAARGKELCLPLKGESSYRSLDQSIHENKEL
jgi:hypothetical protein